MSITVYTHDRIDIAAGPLASATKLLWGGNALQTVNITRNTPRNPQQAIGYLGVVDYTRGIITSDVTLDTILVEGCAEPDIDPAGGSSSINKYAAQTIDLGSETYAMTSFSMAMAAGSPATMNFGWITNTLASYLAVKDQPAASDGTQFAVVLGDEGQGVDLVATWEGTAPSATTDLPVLDTNGNLTTVTDHGVPAGVQSLNIAGHINRDQVLDVRTSLPIAFITTYPVNITADMEVYQMPGTNPPTNPGASQWGKLRSLLVQQRLGATPKKYIKINGMTKITEGESVSVGRYLAYNVHFEGTDIFLPLPSIA